MKNSASENNQSQEKENIKPKNLRGSLLQMSVLLANFFLIKMILSKFFDINSFPMTATLSFLLQKIIFSLGKQLALPKPKPIELKPWTPKWELEFKEEKNRIETVLRKDYEDLFVEKEGIRFIGSTSIKNIRLADPFHDMVLKVNCKTLPEGFIKIMKELGYRLLGKSPHVSNGADFWFMRHIHDSAPDSCNGFDIHVCTPEAHDWVDSVVGFSEYMSLHEDERKIYEDCKSKILESGTTDVREYKKKKLETTLMLRGRADVWRKKNKKSQ